MDRTINLAEFGTRGSRVFAGRERGQEVRRLSHVEKYQDAGDVVVIVAPDNILSINSSFWLGFVGDSIRTLGEAQFRKQFRLRPDRLQPIFENGIREATRYLSPLPPVEKS